MDAELRSLYRRLEANDLDALPAIVNTLTRLGHSISEIFDLVNAKVSINLEVIWDCLKGQEPGTTSELLLAIDEEIQARGWVTERPLNYTLPGFRHSGVVGFESNFNKFPKPFFRTIWSRSLNVPNVERDVGLFLEDEPSFHPSPVIALSEVKVGVSMVTFTLRVPTTLENYKKSLDIVAKLARLTQAGDIEASGFALYKEP